MLRLFAGLLLAWPATQMSAAEAAQISFNVPAGDAVSTLRQAARQAGREIVFIAETVQGVKTAPVQGKFTTLDALNRMVAGTELQIVQEEKDGAITVTRSTPAEKNAASRRDSTAAAQTAEANIQLQKFEVTSSRVDGLINKGVIPTDENAPIYFDVISRQEIERMGATSIEEVLRNTNQISTYSTPNQEASVVQLVTAASLQSNIRMRGFDATQTTVLINGRRIARAQIPGGVNNPSGDLSRIPVAAIERIEVLPMSGSAMYGGGAIGGVINVILRKDYVGRELTALVGTTTQGGATEYTVNYLQGFSFNQGKTTGTMIFDYKKRDPLSLLQRTAILDRAVARMPVETQIATFTQMPGVLRLSATTGDLGIPGATGVRYATLPTGLTPAQANALTPASFTGTAGKFTPSYERYADNYIYTPTEAFSFSGNAEHQLLGGKMTAYGEFNFNSNRQKIRNPKFFSYTLSATHPYNPFRTGVTPGFVGRAVILNVLMTDARPDTTDIRRDTYRAVLGVKGKLGEHWEWTLDGTSEVTAIIGDSQVGGDNINLATFFSTTTNPATFEQRWAVYNLLSDHDVYPVADSVNEQYFNSVAQQRYWQYASNLIARLAGDVYDWRAGTVKTSLGMEEYWWQYEGKRPSSNPQTLIDIMGGAANAPRSIAYSKQARRTQSLFGELTVPVLSRKWRPLPVESLDFNLSARHESADDSQSANTTAAAVKLAVTKDIAFRASRTEGFFPPEQSALHLEDYTFSTSISTSVTLIDPRRGNVTQTYSVVNTAGPNPDLRPETSVAENYGIILTPRFIKGLTLNVDYTKIKKIDAIRTPTAAQLLQNESVYPERVIRGPALAGDPVGWAGPITSFDTRAINISSISTESVDSRISYRWLSDSLGEFTVSGSSTYTRFIETQLLPSSPITNSVRTTDGALRWLGRASLFWNSDRWLAGVTAHYTGSFVTATTAPSPQFPTASGIDGGSIPSQMTWDLQAGYKMPYRSDRSGWRSVLDGTQWTLGALNVLDRLPPYYSSGLYSRYSDPRMRYVYLQVKKTL